MVCFDQLKPTRKKRTGMFFLCLFVLLDLISLVPFIRIQMDAILWSDCVLVKIIHYMEWNLKDISLHLTPDHTMYQKKKKTTTHQQKKHPTIHHQFGSFYFRPKNHKVSWRKQLKLKIGCAYDIMNCPFWCRLLLFDEPAIMSRSMSYLHYVTEFKHLLWSLMSNSAPVRSGGLFARKCAFLPGRRV